MGDKTGIEWCHSTHNFWEGCQKVGPGCDNCYAEERNNRFHHGDNWGPGAPRLLRSPAYQREPMKWERDHEKFFLEYGCRRRVFANSLSDIFDKDAPAGERERAFSVMRDTPHLDWILLTKRIGNAVDMLPPDWVNGYTNVWLGATVVNQEEADRDIPKLLRTPAYVHWLSMEPLLGPILFKKSWRGCETTDHGTLFTDNPMGYWGNKCRKMDGPQSSVYCSKCGCPLRTISQIDWVVAGGESGHAARPMPPELVRDIRDQCEVSDIPFLLKQNGEWGCDEAQSYYLQPLTPNPDLYAYEMRGEARYMHKLGKKRAGRLLDGIEHNGYPGKKS